MCVLSNRWPLFTFPSVLPVCICYLKLQHGCCVLRASTAKTSGPKLRLQCACGSNWWKTLTMKEFGDRTGLAFTAARPLTRVAVAVATHAGELVIVKVRPWRAVRVARHAAQQRVWILHQSLLTLGALVCIRAEAGRTGLVTLCTKSVRSDGLE